MAKVELRFECRNRIRILKVIYSTPTAVGLEYVGCGQKRFFHTWNMILFTIGRNTFWRSILIFIHLYFYSVFLQFLQFFLWKRRCMNSILEYSVQKIFNPIVLFLWGWITFQAFKLEHSMMKSSKRGLWPWSLMTYAIVDLKFWISNIWTQYFKG